MPRIPLSEMETEWYRQDTQSRALVLFSKGGFPGITMRGIADEMGLTAMALYRYFPDGKSEIIEAIRCQGFEKLGEQFRSIEKRVSEPKECFIAMMKGGSKFALENPALYRLVGAGEAAKIEESTLAFLSRLKEIEALKEKFSQLEIFL